MLGATAVKRAVALQVATVVALGATSATAAAAQRLCIGPPGSAVRVAEVDGSCKKKTATVEELVEQAELSALRERAAALKSEADALETKVKALESKLSKVRYSPTGLNGKPALTVDGANLQILSGSGETDGTTNGLGNLFIGYNERSEDTQTGSHNLIIGTRHSFTSFGGLLTGSNNDINGSWSFASGVSNTAGGFGSSVSGGALNTASGDHSSVSGGVFNSAGGIGSSVNGGRDNTAAGGLSSILGGRNNTVIANEGTNP